MTPSATSSVAPPAPSASPPAVIENAQKTALENEGQVNSSQSGLGAGKTFSRQGELPSLPIPKLEDTAKRYLGSLEALQTKEEHETTRKVVENFLQNEGPSLQQNLQEYASSRISYIEEFWDDSYLQASESVVLNLNPFFILEDDPTPSRGSQLMRTTSLILASLAFIHDLRTGHLEPDTVRGTPLDMFQYSKLFGTARIPTANGCKMQTCPDSKHIVVMRRGQLYWFDVLDDQHRPLLTERALLGNLQAILRDADKTKPQEVAKGAIGILTTEQRKIWSGYRDTLSSNKHNSKCLAVADAALFVVCMDDSEPESPSELCNNMLCGTYHLQDGIQLGTCTNRWYDKLQIIVCANGAAGINFEHTGVDGHTVLRFAGDVYAELILRFAKSINNRTKSLFQAATSPIARGSGKKAGAEVDAQTLERVEIATAPKKLEWDFCAEITAGIRYGETRLSDLICQNECQVLEYTNFGKNFITRHKFSPDAFVQAAFQATHYKLYGRNVCTYEPAMTKQFQHGRTEAIRTCQPWTSDFVQSLQDPKIDRDAKLDKLRKACEGHSKLSKQCAQGLGHDRHLYAIYSLAKLALSQGKLSSLPEFFLDAGWSTLNQTILSTSNCGNPALRLFGFGPVSPNGFGIGYIIKDDAISIVASSKHLQTDRWLTTLQEYLNEVSKMMMESYNSANIRPVETYIDHSGVECDVRTGLPIGSRVRQTTKQTSNTASLSTPRGGGNGYDDDFYDGAGGSGYGFFDAGARTPLTTDGNGQQPIPSATQQSAISQKDGKAENEDQAMTQSKHTGGFSMNVGRRLLDADR
ncbi:unnamed protein product [Sympodiomycopsis kandeliae]